MTKKHEILFLSQFQGKTKRARSEIIYILTDIKPVNYIPLSSGCFRLVISVLN